ncbi:hypothetical protein BD410DRAFT_827202 [Rickenella mellea]|uniref:Glycopeptide n=1 Tax=Rickenella mellea TaxID=50990 RepID=A0A4Y7Q9A7_9AGAM|nr:hypothetical protein BD410DRAFT_827202 [Rickenella mellea]
MSSLFIPVILLARVIAVNAEEHIIRFKNDCGSGTPTLVRGGQILPLSNNGGYQDFTSTNPFESAIAYLQTSDQKCLLNGENCVLVEMNMNNPSCPGCGSSVDLSLITPHKYQDSTAFSFWGGDGTCDGLGAVCSDPNCSTAFHQSNDNQVQRYCNSNNVNLLITFCGPQTTGYTPAVANSLSSLSNQAGQPSHAVVSLTPPSTPEPQGGQTSSTSTTATTVATPPSEEHTTTATTHSSASPVAAGTPKGKTCKVKARGRHGRVH